MSIFEYTKVHIINTLCISKKAFRALILSFYSFLIIFYHSEQEKTKINLGKYNTIYPKNHVIKCMIIHEHT
jgi:hypothetical protein